MFPDGNGDGGELILSCPVLETLRITRCYLSNIKVFTVSTPRLDNLVFFSLCMERCKSCQVKTCTPNLKTIEVFVSWDENNSMLDYCLENLASLLSARVRCYSYSDPNFIPKKEFSEWLMKVLTGIQNVQSLLLWGHSLQLLAAFPESFNKLSDMFSNLKSLILDERESPDSQAVLKLLFREDVPWRRERSNGYFTSYQRS